jgi:haloacetate dehalogenase
VVLLHGFPETNFAWRHQIPVLAERYRVVAPDLRGYGDTDKPAAGYDKRTMALDLVELLRALRIPKIALVGHDQGARVATRSAKDHPALLDRLVVMDNVPTRIVARSMNAQTARAYWFFFFHLCPSCPRAALLGFSEGCAMSAMFAASYPERVSHLICFGGFARCSCFASSNGPCRRRRSEIFRARVA